MEYNMRKSTTRKVWMQEKGGPSKQEQLEGKRKMYDQWSAYLWGRSKLRNVGRVVGENEKKITRKRSIPVIIGAYTQKGTQRRPNPLRNRSCIDLNWPA